MSAIRPTFGGPTRDRIGPALLPTTLSVLLIAVFLVTVPGVRSARAGGSTWFSVETTYNRVRGDGWMPGARVTVTVDDPTTAANPDGTKTFTMGSNPTFSASLGFSVHAGDVVTVTDGISTGTHVVTALRAAVSDEAADAVGGFANPGATVYAWVQGHESPAHVTVTAGGSGWWAVDFAGVWNLNDGTTMRFREYDANGNSTEIYVPLPIDPDRDHDGISNIVDNCPSVPNATQYDGDGDGVGTRCDDVDRIWGPNRYGTAAAVSGMAFDEADAVLIALGTNFPDALVAAAAGGFKDAPVLLTRSDALPAETIAEIGRLHPTTAYIVGGTAVIKPSVEAQLQTFVPTVIRLSGANRYETSSAVAETFFPSATRVFVALGENFPDALVAAAAAGAAGAPVLLTRHDHVPASTLFEVNRLHPTTIYIVGGTAAISATVDGELAPYGTVKRLAGANRYETAEAVADESFGGCGNRAFLAYGGNFPDALVAAAAAGHLDAPVLLVTHDTIPASTRRALDDSPKVHDWVVGGTAVIGDAVFDALP